MSDVYAVLRDIPPLPEPWRPIAGPPTTAALRVCEYILASRRVACQILCLINIALHAADSLHSTCIPGNRSPYPSGYRQCAHTNGCNHPLLPRRIRAISRPMIGHGCDNPLFCQANPHRSHHAPYPVEKQHQKRCQHAQFQARHTFVRLIWKHDEELHQRRSQAQKRAFSQWFALQNGQQKKKSPDSTPDNAWIEPSRSERRGNGHMQRMTHAVMAEQPDREAVGQRPNPPAAKQIKSFFIRLTS